MCKLYRSELGCRKPKTNAESYGISITYAFISGAILGGLLLIFGRQFLSLFATEPAVIDAGMQRIRIMGFSYAFSCFYGWQHRCFPWHRKKYPSHRYRHPGILCIPYHLDLHGVRTFPDDIRAVSSLYLLMGDHRICGNSFSLLSASKKYVHNERNSSPLLMVGVLLLKDDNPA